MKKIPCSCHHERSPTRIVEGAVWLVFGGVAICESCRLVTIAWLQEQGISPWDHPFGSEFCGIKDSIIDL